MIGNVLRNRRRPCEDAPRQGKNGWILSDFAKIVHDSLDFVRAMVYNDRDLYGTFVILHGLGAVKT